MANFQIFLIRGLSWISCVPCLNSNNFSATANSEPVNGICIFLYTVFICDIINITLIIVILLIVILIN